MKIRPRTNLRVSVEWFSEGMEFPSLLQRRAEEVAQHEGPDTQVLLSFLQDLNADGAATKPVLDELEQRANAVCGTDGLAIIIASDTPTGKGRAIPGKKSAPTRALPRTAAIKTCPRSVRDANLYGQRWPERVVGQRFREVDGNRHP